MSIESTNSLTESQTKANKLNCVVVGDGMIGKTSMIKQFIQEDIQTKYSPTLYEKHFVSFEVAQENFHMEIRDTSGQLDYSRLRSLGYSDVDAFIICYSVGNLISYENITTKWIPEIKKYSPKTPFILVGLKTDLRLKQNTLDTKKKIDPISYKTGAALAAQLKRQKCCNYVECSSTTNVGVQNVFREAVLTFLHNKEIKKEKTIKYRCRIL